MNINGSRESSEGIRNSTNIPFTTLLNIPLGIGNLPLPNSSSSMLTPPPPTPDIVSIRNGNHTLDARSTPTSVSSVLEDPVRTQQHLNFANTAGLLQSPECLGIINSLIRRHQLETPPTPTVQPTSDSVLSLWPTGTFEDYLGFINIGLIQHQQESPTSFSQPPNGNSVRSLWPSAVGEDEGSCNRSVPYSLINSFASHEHANTLSQINSLALLRTSLSSPSGGSNHASTITTYSPKSPSRRNNKSSCSPKSQSRGLSHIAPRISCSPKSPGRENINTAVSKSYSPRSASRTQAFTHNVSEHSVKPPYAGNAKTCYVVSPGISYKHVAISSSGSNSPKPSVTNERTCAELLLDGSRSSSSVGTNLLIERSQSPNGMPLKTLAMSKSKCEDITECKDSASNVATSSSLIIPVIRGLNKDISQNIFSQPWIKGSESEMAEFSSGPTTNILTVEDTYNYKTNNTGHKLHDRNRNCSKLWVSPEAITKQYPELSCPFLGGEPNTFEEEKIDVWSVKDSLLLKVVEPHPVIKDLADSGYENKDNDDTAAPGSPEPLSNLGTHCSRTVPSLMKFYSRHKRSLNSSLSINLAVSGQATPPCSPISPGTHLNSLQLPNSGSYPITSPSSIMLPNNLITRSSPISGIPFKISHQTSPHEELNVTIPANAHHTQSFSNAVSRDNMSQNVTGLNHSHTKKLSLEASTMTSPTEGTVNRPAVVTMSSSASYKGPEYNTSTTHCCITTTTTTQVNDTNVTRPSPIAALTLLTVPTVVPNSLYSPVTTASHAKVTTPSTPIKQIQKLKEDREQSAFTHASLPLLSTTSTTSAGTIPSGMHYSSPWSIPHNPLAHSGSYWLPPPSQFSGVEAGVGAASLGLGYHVARDQLTGQIFLLPRPHPLSDHGGHGLMWTGYGSMAAPPVVMTPQQLLLSDPHYRHALHPSLMHVHHPPPSIHSSQSAKKMESPSVTPKDEDKKSLSPIGAIQSPSVPELSLSSSLSASHFLFPPTTLPYFFSPPPHPSHYSLTGFPHGPASTLGLPAGLIQSITTNPFTTSTPTLTTAAGVLAPLTVTTTLSNVKISSTASSTVWSRGSDIPISSPGLHYEPLIARHTDLYSDPPMDLTQRRSKSPQRPKEDLEAKPCSNNHSKSSITLKPKQNSKVGVAIPKFNRPITIKKEIKEEVLSPPLTAVTEEDPATEPKEKPNIKVELSKAFTNKETPQVSCSEQALSYDLELQSLCSTTIVEQPIEKIAYTKSYSPNHVIDSSGLELLLETFLQHGDRLAPSLPQDLDSNSSHSEQMPHLERAASTPSPRFSPCSYESMPPVLTPFAPTPTIFAESAPGSQSPTPIPPHLDICHFDKLGGDPDTVMLTSPQPSSSCFSVLCALAEQRILEEQQNSCSALSSLAEVALSVPSVPTDQPLYEVDSLEVKPAVETLKQASAIDELFATAQPEASTSHSELVNLNLQIQPNDKAIDFNRNYKSPESEREIKAFIANKVSQYHKEYVNDVNSLVPNFQMQIEEMDPAEIDMRMQLAAIQKKYKEKQHELAKLLPKKDSLTPSKRGRGRPPKPKLNTSPPSIKRKVGRPLKKFQETLSEAKENDENCTLKIDFDTNNYLNVDSRAHSASPVPISRVQSSSPESLKENKPDETSDDEVYAHSNNYLLFKSPVSQLQDLKHEDSDDDARSEASLSKRDQIQLQAETSVESSTSDAEIHMSSSKKRKPGRPKKHSPTKYDATETIVAKKSKSLGFLLLQKSKIKPKLKAELKIRDSDEEEDDNNDFSHLPTKYPEIPDEDLEELNSMSSKPSVLGKSKGTVCISKKLLHGVQLHGAPRGRASLSRNTILRDKEKRKTTFEKNSQMEQLFRSLKRHSKVADPEHDESGDERENDNSEDDEFDAKKLVTKCNIVEPHPNDLSMSSISNSTTGSCQIYDHETNEKSVAVKKETNTCDVSLGETPVSNTPIMNEIKEEKDIKADDKDGETSVPGLEKEKDVSVCTLQVEDLVRGARVLVLQDGLLYAGNLVPITPPDVYGVHIDGERGTRPHICCQEELLTQSWKEVKPGSTRFLTEGTRVCAFWSQQYRGLYPGSVAAASSPSHEGNHNLVNVEFDDGDSGRIHVDDIRLLPQDFPVIEYDPNPLITLNKRKRRPTEEDAVDTKSSENANKKMLKDCAQEDTMNIKNKVKNEDLTKKSIDVESGLKLKNNTILINVKMEKDVLVPPLAKHNLDKDDETKLLAKTHNEHFDGENLYCNKKIKVKKWSTDRFLSDGKNSVTKSIKRRRTLSLSSSGKKHKKRRHSETHKHRHRHKKRRRTLEDSWLHPHIEQGDNELRMRIRSPPPHQEDFIPPHLNLVETSTSDKEEPIHEKQQEKTLKKPQRRIKRSPSEKSKIAPFLPEKQLWKWSGKGYKRPGGKGKGKKEFYKEIVRGKECIRVGDCAVFLSSGSPDRPFIGKIDFLWEGWGGNMVVKVRWFYHPDETKEAERKLADPRDALFSSSHTDENDVQTISHRCEVISLAEYKLRRTEINCKKDMGSKEAENNDDLYYLAGYYDTTYGRITMEPGVS